MLKKTLTQETSSMDEAWQTLNMPAKLGELQESGSAHRRVNDEGNGTPSVEAQHGRAVTSSAEAPPPVIVVWRNVVLFAALHLFSLYALTLVPQTKSATLVWAVFVYVVGAVGVTAGAHRLWSHRAYKAKLPLKVLLMCMNSTAFQNSILEWARDHRMHHKFTETDADPHNAKRGFFFSHIGWLLTKKHPDVKEKGKSLNMSDLLQDKIVMLQHRHYKKMVFVFCFVIPVAVPILTWDESIYVATFVSGFLRYCALLNGTWLVNSAAHMWGSKPYDINIDPAENYSVSFLTVGEGFHNYHHTFPYDYSTSEFGWKLNVTTFFIDLMYRLGQVYDRRSVSKETVLKRKQRTGDGSRQILMNLW